MIYICKECGVKIIPSNMHTPGQCILCRNKYMMEYQRVRRWLNGGDDDHLLGEDLNIGLRSVNGNLRVTI